MTSPTLMNTYGRQPVTFVRGEGVRLFDEQGKSYLDAVSGIAVNALGHSHPGVTEAIQRQAGELLHTSNLYNVKLQQELADMLHDVSGMDNTFFCNSGAEGNEAAIKLARLHGHRRGIELPHVVVFEQSFHGRTLATMTASGNRKIQVGFEPLVRGFTRAPYGDIEALETIAKNSDSVAGVLVEPIQGEAGVIVPPEGYLKNCMAACGEHGALFIADEVQTGIGRTGRMLAIEHEGVRPHLVVLGKALGVSCVMTW